MEPAGSSNGTDLCITNDHDAAVGSSFWTSERRFLPGDRRLGDNPAMDAGSSVRESGRPGGPNLRVALRVAADATDGLLRVRCASGSPKNGRFLTICD